MIHRVLLIASFAAIWWGAFAFGAVYSWAHKPLAVACGILGLAAIVVERRGRPAVGGVAIGLGAILLGIGLQLIPLQLPTLLRVSPATDALLQQYDFKYQIERSAATGTAFGVEAATPFRHPISIAPDQTVHGAYLFTAFALFLVGMTRLVSVVSAKRVGHWLIVTGGVLAIVGIVQRALTANDIRPLVYGFWQPRSENAVPFGPFINANHFAGWMLMALPVALAAFLELLLREVDTDGPQRRSRIAIVTSPHVGALVTLAGTCLIMGLSLLMTRSRSGLAAFAIGTLLAGWVAFRRQSGRAAQVAVAGSVLALLLATLGWAGLDTVTSKFTDAQASKSLTSRLAAWRDTLHIIRDFPVTGTGFNTYGAAMMVYQTNERRLHFRETHNDYLQLAAEGGLLLGIPIVATVGVFVRDVRRRFREAPRTGTTYYLRVGAVVGLVSIALQSLIEFSLQMPGNAALCALLGAIALHQSPNLRRGGEDAARS
jgi:O-antigen ligase